MRRVILMQSDSRFEKYLDVALRTFLSKNDRKALRLEFVLLDLGLTEEQIKKYSRLASIFKVKNDPRWGRFIHAQARLDTMASLCDEGALVFQLDADTLSLESVGDWIETFESSSHEFSAVSEWPHHLFVQFNSGKPIRRMIESYPELGKATFSDSSWNFGVVMIKGRRGSDLCRTATNIMEDHRDALPWAEQSAFNAAFYGTANSKCLAAGRSCNFMLNVHQMKIVDDWKAYAIDGEGGYIRIVHYAGHDVKIREKGPYFPHEELWLHWAAHAPKWEDLV